MERWQGKTAIVTGASAGIGAAISIALTNYGLKVVGIARRKDRLDALAKTLLTSPGSFHPFRADVSSEPDLLAAFAFAKTLGPIHVLINNAGVMRNTNLADGDSRLWKEVFDVNVVALCVATREAVRDMKGNGVDGHIVHLNSMSGHRVANPRGNVYAASKFAVTALTETLRQELGAGGSRIKVSSVSPGVTETEFAEASGVGRPQQLQNPLTAADIADAVVYILNTPPHVQVHELMLRPLEQTF